MGMISRIQARTADPFGRHTHDQWAFAPRAAHPDALFFQQVIESSTTPVLVMDVVGAEQRLVYANPAFESLLGYRREEILGRDWRVFLSVHESSRHTQTLHASLRSGSSTEQTLVAVRNDGTLLYFKSRLSPLCDAHGAIRQYVAVLHDVTLEHRLRETLEYRACFDPLTGLANRYLLHDRFAQAAAQAQRHAAVYTLSLLDLDGFKQINDRFGHAAGDEVLGFFGAQLLQSIRSEDTAARLGGDEFVLLLMDADTNSTRVILQRVRTALAAFSPAGLEEPLGLSCSAGVTLFPADGTTLAGLLDAADKRLYAAKTRSEHGAPDTRCPAPVELIERSVRRR